MHAYTLSDSAFNELERLTDQVGQDLLNPENIFYFEINPQLPHEHQINGGNKDKLSQVSALAGVYAIWVKEGNKIIPRYIGHTAGKTARTRLTNHFFKKHPLTGSQLLNVKQAVAAGYEVGFTYVSITPPLIRLYVESALINRFQELCVWNIHSKGSKRKSTMLDTIE